MEIKIGKVYWSTKFNKSVWIKYLISSKLYMSHCGDGKEHLVYAEDIKEKV